MSEEVRVKNRANNKDRANKGVNRANKGVKDRANKGQEVSGNMVIIILFRSKTWVNSSSPLSSNSHNSPKLCYLNNQLNDLKAIFRYIVIN